MIMLFAALAGLALQGAEPGWTWSLYEGEGPVVLANDVPDTARLRATLECEPGSGVARLASYGAEAEPGMATLRSGAATAATEAQAGRNGKLTAVLRTDHPVFASFVRSGRMVVTVAGHERTVEVQPAHLAKLRRFAELCSG